MGKAPNQEEMFPDIAENASKDIITKRREEGKKISVISEVRKVARYSEAKEKEKKSTELKEKRKKIIDSDPANNPNWRNLKEAWQNNNNKK